MEVSPWDKIVFALAIFFLLFTLVSLARNIDRYECLKEEKRKEREEREKKKNAQNEVSAEQILKTIRAMEEGFAMNPSPTPPRVHVFAELHPDSDILVCKYCGKADPDLSIPCVQVDKDPDCDMKYLATYAKFSKHNFFCFNHQWHSDNGMGCKSPFRTA
jgi:hypothetical protein